MDTGDEMKRLLIYRLLCLILIAQACFAIAGTLTVWRGLLESTTVGLVVGVHLAMLIMAGVHYVVPTRRVTGLGLAGIAALVMFVWVGMSVPGGPTYLAQAGRLGGLAVAWMGLHLLAPRAVEEWKEIVGRTDLSVSTTESPAVAAATR